MTNQRRRGISSMTAFATLALVCVAGPQSALAQGQPPPAPGQAPPVWGEPRPAPPPPSQPQPGQPTAGGLAPPPPMGQTDPNSPYANQGGQPPPGQAGQSQVEQDLDKAKAEDSGRGFKWVRVFAEGGFQHVGLQTFNVDEENFTAGFVDTSASGGVIGVGVGIGPSFVMVGPRARIGFFDAFQLFSIGGELSFHIPLGPVEPNFDIGAGYTGLGSFSSAVTGAGDAIEIRGLDIRAGGGLDVFVTPVFSLGAKLAWEFLALTRPGVSASDIQNIQNSAESPDEQDAADGLAAEGSGYGSAISITAALGLHF